MKAAASPMHASLKFDLRSPVRRKVDDVVMLEAYIPPCNTFNFNKTSYTSLADRHTSIV